MKWSFENIPGQAGKVIVVTGANSGIGYWTTYHLAKNHAEVIMACRNMTKANEAADRIRRDLPHARLALVQLNLADIESIRNFSTEVHKFFTKIDVLINNAGVMHLPEQRTAQGFELHFGVNHLGHFVLTALLFDLIAKKPGSRIVTVSSLLHKKGEINFDDLNREKIYSKREAYAQSKLANLLFMLELDKRIRLASKRILSVAAHPGWAATHLQEAGPEMEGKKVQGWIQKHVSEWFAQSAEDGSLPLLYAATANEVRTGRYYGPSGMGSMRGYPAGEEIDPVRGDMGVAARLWKESEKLTGIEFQIK